MAVLLAPYSYSKLSHDRRLLVPTASALGLHPAPLRIQSDSSNLPHRTSNPCLCHTSAKSARNPFPCHTYNFARLQSFPCHTYKKQGGYPPLGVRRSCRRFHGHQSRITSQHFQLIALPHYFLASSPHLFRSFTK